MSETLPMTQVQWNASIVHRESDYLAISKPATIAVQSRDHRDLMEIALTFEGRRPQLVHRIDQPCTGLVLLPFTSERTARFSQAFRDRTITKTYLAIVGEMPKTRNGHLLHYLSRLKDQNRVKAVPTGKGKRAELEYAVVASSDHYHLLRINLITGRQHQIRAQLGAIGSPIKGDNKYGFKRGNKDRSIHLHCWKMEGGPLEQELMAPLPDEPLWNYFGSVLS